MRQTEVHAQFNRLAHNIGLAHGDQRRMNLKLRRAFSARLRREIRHLRESLNKLRPAIRIARIINRIHANEDIRSVADFRVRQRERQKNGVARRNISDGNTGGHGAFLTVFRNLNLRRQGRSAKNAEINPGDSKFLRAQLRRYLPRRFHLDHMPLPIIKGQAEAFVSLLFRNCKNCAGIQTAAQQANSPRVV